MKRLLGSLLIGVIAGVIAVAWIDSASHAALVASAAKSHSTVASILTGDFIGAAVAVAIIAFACALVGSRRRKARAAAPRERGPAPRRRSRAGAGW